MDKRLILLLVCITVVFSCKKNDCEQLVPDGVNSLTVSLSETKTSISEPSGGKRSVSWTAGDCVCVNGQTSNPLESVQSGTSVATFTFAQPLSAPLRILYPASFYKDGSHIVLPYSQNKMPGDDDIATDTFPMFGYSSNTEGLSLNYLCAIVKLQIRLNGTDTTKISYVEFSGNNDEQVCGEFGIDYTDGTLSGASTNPLSKSVRCFCIKEGVGGKLFVCNIVIPAGTYSKGFNVRIVDSHGNYMDKKTTSSKTFNSGTVSALTAFDFEAEGKSGALCISSAEQLIAFAQDWNAFKFEACEADVMLTSDIVFDETTSAAFVATKGIGNTISDGVTNHYNGNFCGNGFSIKNLTSTVPVFAQTGGAANINNLVIDESCTFTCPADGATDWGVIAGRQKGLVSDCTCEANVTIEANTLKAKRYIGGISGRVYGADICRSDYTGTISFSGGTFTDYQISIGGIAGAVDSEGGEITDCSLKGQIIFGNDTDEYAGPGYTGENTIAMFIGGIVGNVTKNATIDGCMTESGSRVRASGKFAARVGGIVGFTAGGSVRNCSNSAKVKYFSNEARAKTTQTYIGGIAGFSGDTKAAGADITFCSNLDSVATKCNSTTLALGGIAGRANGKIANCNNASRVDRFNAGASTAQRNRYCSIGGIVGDLCQSSYVTDCLNSGKIYSQDHTTYTNATYDVGGIVGTANGTCEITGCECTSPDVRSRGISKDIIKLARDNIGGIAGYLISSTINNCTASSTQVYSLYAVNSIEGCICGTMDSSSKILSSKVISSKINKNDAEANLLGAVCGKTAEGSEISNCAFSGKWSKDGGTSWTDFTIDDIASDTNFTGSGNSLYSATYNLTGTVSCGGTGLKDVVVSDGYTSVLTDKNGKYYIDARDSATCVFVSIPSGYMVSSTTGVPAFWKKLSTVSASGGIKTVNFTLNEMSDPDNFTIYMYADIQIRPTTMWYDNIGFRSHAVAEDVFSDIADRAKATGGNIIGISLGDQVHDRPSALDDYYITSAELGKLNFPNFSIPGNHDYDVTCTDFIKGIATFESKLAPSHYSLNVGKYHIVMLDNARTRKKADSDSLEAETKGLPLGTLEWLKGDLKHVPTTTPIILCSHRALFMEIYTGEETPRLRDISTRSWVLGGEYADLLTSYKKVYAFNGDAHNVFNYAYTSGTRRNIECHCVPRATGELWTNQFMNQCGTPRGYLEIKVSGENLTYKFKPVAYQTGGCTHGPDPMTYRDFKVSEGKFVMKSTYTSKSGAVLDDFYQIHAYAPGCGYGAATTYPNDVIATVFMYDERWGDVTFEYDGGSLKMTRITIEENLREPGYSWLQKWYKENDSQMKIEPGYANSYPLHNAFHCTPPASVKKGTIKVSDHFGNDYEYGISW